MGVLQKSAYAINCITLYPRQLNINAITAVKRGPYVLHGERGANLQNIV